MGDAVNSGGDGAEPTDPPDAFDEDQPGRRSPLLAAAGSAVWPGLGHVLAGQRRRGAIIASAALLVLGAGLLYVSRQRTLELASWTLQPRWLRVTIVASIAVLVVRLLIGLDAYRRAARGGRPSAVHGLVLMLLLVLAAAPHIILVRYSWTQLNVLNTVFTNTETVAAEPTPLATTTTVAVSTSTTTAPTTATTAAPSTSAPLETTTTTEPAPTTVPNWDGHDRLTILFLGGDGGFDRSGVRTDTIIALSIEVATGDAVAFSIPRNWQRLQFPANTPAAERWPEGYLGLANEVYNLGVRYPTAFPGTDDPGGASIKAAVAQLLGTPVHYYAMVDMVGVVDAIDLFGGVDVYVTEWIDDDIKPITPGGPRLIIQTRPGERHFDGLTALAYMRARTTSSDYHRMTRQRCVVGALVDQVGVASVLANYPALADIISDHLITDIPLDRLPELLDLAARLDTDRILTLNFIPPEWKRGWAPIPEVRAAVTAAFAAEFDGEIEDLESACDPPGAE